MTDREPIDLDELERRIWAGRNALGASQEPHEITLPSATVLALLERLRRAEGLLWGLLDSDECRYDHHGYCQTHGPGSIPCPVNEARKFLNSAGARREPDATQGVS